jgi:hypothetical protein
VPAFFPLPDKVSAHFPDEAACGYLFVYRLSWQTSVSRHHHATFQVAAGHPGSGLYLMATPSNGISALATATPARSRPVQVGWLICAKLRHSRVAPNRNPFAGLVEVD